MRSDSSRSRRAYRSPGRDRMPSASAAAAAARETERVGAALAMPGQVGETARHGIRRTPILGLHYPVNLICYHLNIPRLLIYLLHSSVRGVQVQRREMDRLRASAAPIDD